MSAARPPEAAHSLPEGQAHRDKGERVSTMRDDVRPRIGAGFRLQFEPAQNCHVLLYPEGMVKLNQSAGEILSRCDGERTLSAIVDDLERAFAAKGLRGDVEAFLAIAVKQNWVSGVN